jgi:hypothetical protein
MCGSSVFTEPPPVSYYGKTLPTTPSGYTKGLFFVALSLIVTPALRIYSISQEFAALSGDRGQSFLIQHPGVDKLFYFEIGMNTLLVLAALLLNFLFYTRSRFFPASMVVYVAVTFAYRLAVTAAMHTLFPDAVFTPTTVALIQYLIWGLLMAGYLLLDPEVQTRFRNQPAESALSSHAV